MLELRPEPLTVENFKSFGEVIETRQDSSFLINEGTTRRYHALAEVDTTEQGKAIISIFRATARPWPIALRMLERHPLGSQAFIPMQEHPWLIVVADTDADKLPSAQDCRIFIARGDQGIQYNRNVWHHPLLSINPMQNFTVVDRQGPGDNLEEHWFTDDGAVILLP